MISIAARRRRLRRSRQPQEPKVDRPRRQARRRPDRRGLRRLISGLHLCARSPKQASNGSRGHSSPYRATVAADSWTNSPKTGDVHAENRPWFRNQVDVRRGHRLWFRSKANFLGNIGPVSECQADFRGVHRVRHRTMGRFPPGRSAKIRKPRRWPPAPNGQMVANDRDFPEKIAFVSEAARPSPSEIRSVAEARRTEAGEKQRVPGTRKISLASGGRVPEPAPISGGKSSSFPKQRGCQGFRRRCSRAPTSPITSPVSRSRAAAKGTPWERRAPARLFAFGAGAELELGGPRPKGPTRSSAPLSRRRARGPFGWLRR